MMRELLVLAMAACCGCLATASVARADGSGLAESAFVPLFNGRDLSGWVGNTDVYWVPEEGVLQCGGRKGVTPRPDDSLMTVREYADFVVRFEFRTWENGDNGFGFRYPGVDDMAYSGVEMQLADTARAQHTRHNAMGGFYGVSEALDDRTPTQPILGGTYLKPMGEWNACELKAEGPRVTAWLNGVKVNECDLSTKNPATGYDRHPHAGVRAKKGHFIWWVGNPNVPVQWRNLRVAELKAAELVDPGKRRFLYSDFMNRKLVYVDEANPAAYWEDFLPGVAFDLTKCGLNRLVVPLGDRWRLYDLGQMRLIREYRDPEHLRHATSAVRLSDGRTFVLDGAKVHEYDAAGAWQFAYTFGDRIKESRTLRFTGERTARIGTNGGFADVALDRALAPEKRVLRWTALPDVGFCYDVQSDRDGTCLVTTGYGHELIRVASDGKVLSRARARQPEGLFDFFYGSFSRRPNGNVLVAHWSGHSGRDFRPGWKLIEFTPAGEVAWHWESAWAGTPCAVLSFD